MRLRHALSLSLAGALFAVLVPASGAAEKTLPTLDKRYADASVKETPSFQRHVLPLMGRLGCNGRACHGSFQGQGGFRLSLFGYDFKADHKALLERIDTKTAGESLLVQKPSSEDEHDGGQRYKPGSWQERVFLRWIESGAKDDSEQAGVLTRLEVTPSEIVFRRPGDSIQLRAVAVWSDGTREDVTSISRFQTNDDSVAKVDEHGRVTCEGKGDTHVVVFYDNGITPAPVMLPVSDQVAENYPELPAPTKIDELIHEKLKKVGIVPSEICADTEFLRRVSLDLTGTLPTPAEIKAFVADDAPDKRAKKVEELLERPAYAAWWTTKLCDLTGNNDRNTGNNTFRRQESQQWYDWIYERIRRNESYDKIVEGIALATSRQGDESFEEYCRNIGQYYRDDESAKSFAERDYMPHFWSRRTVRQPKDKALSFSYAFLGVRLQCAECHKHPFDQWSKQDFEQFTAFFNGVQYNTPREDRDAMTKLTEKLGLKGKRNNDLRRMLPKLLDEGKVIPFREVFVDSSRAFRGRRTNNKNRRYQGRVITPKLLGGEEVVLNENAGDPRNALMRWMRDPENPYFSRAIVNRVWANYFNVGIIDPPDDLNLANPPSNEPLLDWLAKEFVRQGYDLKWLHRTIINSHAYQRSWKPNETNVHDERNFSRAVPRRLPAEVVYDALRQATAADTDLAKYATTYEERAIGYMANSSTYGGRGNYSLLAFGKPARETNCDCERSMEPSLLQTLYLRNDNEMLSLIERRQGWLNELARENRLAFTPAAGSSNNRAYARLRAKLAPLYKQTQKINQEMKRAAKKNDAKALEKLREQRKELYEQIGKLRRKAGIGASKGTGDAAADDKAAKAKLVAEKGPQLIREAYLRTVSRSPTKDELERSLDYLRESDSVMKGVRDVMWALLNTKEFLVNH